MAGSPRRNSVPVVVLRLDHYGALGVMRSLGRLGVDVYGVHANDQAPAFRSRYCRGAFVWDLEKAPVSESINFLCNHVSRKIGSRAILLPSNDETALFVAENARSLRGAFLFPNLSAGLAYALYDKRKMYLLAKRLGIPTPECVFPESATDMARFSRHARFPLVLKAIDGAAVSKRAGKKTAIAHSPQELLQQYQLMEDPREPSLMVQQHIPGEAWTFSGYFDQNSECLFGSTGKKLRQAPAYCGMTSLGVCQKNEALESMTKYFMKSVGYKGILDIDYCHDARDGEYKVLDVNPRLGATFRLFVGANDTDVVRALYWHLTGKHVPPSRVPDGRKWFVEDLDFASSVQYHKDGVLSWRRWRNSFHGVREAAWFASDDLLPFCGMCIQFMIRAGKKIRAS